MTQRLRLATDIGQRGVGYTEYEIRAVLSRSGTNNWTLTSVVGGASSDNVEFTRQLAQRAITTTGGSVRNAKDQANALLKKAAATFLGTSEARLTNMNTTWIDDSD